MASTPASSATAGRVSGERGSPAAFWSRTRLPYLLLAPTVLVVFAFLIWPILSLLFFSTQSTPIGDKPTFVGTGNFGLLFAEAHFQGNLVASLEYLGGVLVLSVPLAYFAAVLISSRGGTAGIFRTLFLLPWVTAPVVSAILFRTMVDADGPVPTVLAAMTGKEWLFLVRSNLSILTVILHSAWRSFPLEMLLIAAGLATIPMELYESARVDGASEWTQFRYITFPLTRRQLFIAVLLITIFTLQDSESIFAITRGGPGYATETVGVRLFKEAFIYSNMGISSAIGVILILLCIVFLALYLRILGRGQAQ